MEEIELLKKKYKKKLDKFPPPEVRYCLEEEDLSETIEKTQYPKIMLIIKRLNGSILDDWLQDYFNSLGTDTLGVHPDPPPLVGF